MDDGILPYGEHFEEMVEDGVHERVDDVKHIFEKEISLEIKRVIRSKVNYVHAGIKIGLNYCSRCPSTKFCIGEKIYVHDHCLRADFRVKNVLKKSRKDIWSKNML